ncbi:MAG: prolyl oligopeptidase family serine peptidase, partial [Planctomycetales bacterium]
DNADGPTIRFHQIGSSPDKDRDVFGDEFGPGKGLHAELSRDGRKLLVTAYHGAGATKTEVFYRDLEKGGPFVPVVNDLDAQFSPVFAGELIVMQTDWKAPNGRILLLDPEQEQGLERDKWREIIPEQDAALQSFTLAGGRVFARYLENVRPRVTYYNLQGERQGEMRFPDLGSVSSIHGEWERDEAFYSFQSFHLPSTIHRYRVAAAESSVWNRAEVPFDGSDFTIKQEWHASKDGTRIPMFIVHQKDVKLDGSHPTLLTGYGGFNISYTPGFSTLAAIWVERGGVFAVANLRGGGEFGERWHAAGMRGNKQNVFDDFISAAEHLIQLGYTKSSRLAVSGGSNGGLLVGATVTQRPDLCRAAICSVPLLDMLRYHKFLVARFWTPEYGSSENPTEFKTLHAYSPYHHVRQGAKYPAMMFVTGDADTRVDPLHARKMAALMQNATGSDHPVLLRYDTDAGHIGSMPVHKTIDLLADQLQFLLWSLDVEPAP